MNRQTITLPAQLKYAQLVNANRWEELKTPRPAEPSDAEKLLPLLKQIQHSLQMIEGQIQLSKKESARFLAEMSGRLLTHLVGRSDLLKTERLAVLIESQLEDVEVDVELRLHPASAKRIQQRLPDLEDSFSGKIIESDSVSETDCELRFDTHALNSSLERSMEQLVAAALEVIDDD